MTAIRKVGMLGLGKMGAPMARHLIAKGYNVAGYDPVDAARQKAAVLGVTVCRSPRGVAQAADLVIVVVGFDHEVETVMFGAGGVMEAARPDLIVAIGSTVAPGHPQPLAAPAAQRGVAVLAAPPARGEAAALAGHRRRLGGRGGRP